MKHLILILLAVFLFSSAGFAVDNASDNLTLPHSFSSGETISSSKMNENFSNLQVQIIQNKIHTDNNSLILGDFQIVSGLEYSISKIKWGNPFINSVLFKGKCVYQNDISTSQSPIESTYEFEENLDAGSVEFDLGRVCNYVNYFAIGKIGSQTILLENAIFLFETSRTYNHWHRNSNNHILCESDQNRWSVKYVSNCSNIKAVIAERGAGYSIESISNLFVDGQKVYSFNGVLIANNWSELFLSTGLQYPLNHYGFGNSEQYFWTGARNFSGDGDQSSTCNYWSSTHSGIGGVGSFISSSNWLNNDFNCRSKAKFLCACY